MVGPHAAGGVVPAVEEEDESDDATEWRTLAVGAGDHGQRLDRFLASATPEFSRTYLQRLVEDGRASIDGRAARSASRRLRVGQIVRVELVPTAQSLAFRPEPVEFGVVYEDDDLLVVDKPAGLVVHPAAGNWSGTLLNGLLARDARAAALPRAGIVHRLDKDTSGLMVVARTREAMTALVRSIASREVRREYLALVVGEVPWPQTTIEAPIGRDPRARVKMAVVAGGRAARTDVRRLRAVDGVSALRCRLHTGRTHQIRVHLASRGFPLVGDELYGGRPMRGLRRQALHAALLEFRHPTDGRILSFRSALPVDLAAAWVGPTDDADGEGYNATSAPR